METTIDLICENFEKGVALKREIKNDPNNEQLKKELNKLIDQKIELENKLMEENDEIFLELKMFKS